MSKTAHQGSDCESIGSQRLTQSLELALDQQAALAAGQLQGKQLESGEAIFDLPPIIAPLQELELLAHSSNSISLYACSTIHSSSAWPALTHAYDHWHPIFAEKMVSDFHFSVHSSQGYG